MNTISKIIGTTAPVGGFAGHGTLHRGGCAARDFEAHHQRGAYLRSSTVAACKATANDAGSAGITSQQTLDYDFNPHG